MALAGEAVAEAQQHLRPSAELEPGQAPAHRFREDPRQAVLRRLPYWQQLKAEYDGKRREGCARTHCRTFSVRAARDIVKRREDQLLPWGTGEIAFVRQANRTSEWRSASSRASLCVKEQTELMAFDNGTTFDLVQN